MKLNYCNQFTSYYKDNIINIRVASIIFILAIITGAILAGFYEEQQLTVLHKTFVNYLNEEDIYGYAIYGRSFQFICIIFLAVVFCGFIKFGYIIAFFLYIIYGIPLGFSVGLLFLLEGLSGLLFAAAAIVPQNVLLLPSLTFLLVASASFSLSLNCRYKHNYDYKSYIYTVIIFALPFVFGLFVKKTITPVFIYWARNLL